MNEVNWLMATTLMTGVMWLPVLLGMIETHGVMAALGNRAEPLPLSAWAARGERARQNAIQNLVLFGGAVLGCSVLEATNASTLLAAKVYFIARAVHYLSYVLGVIGVRTLAFASGWLATIYIAWTAYIA